MKCEIYGHKLMKLQGMKIAHYRRIMVVYEKFEDTKVVQCNQRP